jgi:hypothetical protein
MKQVCADKTAPTPNSGISYSMYEGARDHRLAVASIIPAPINFKCRDFLHCAFYGKWRFGNLKYDVGRDGCFEHCLLLTVLLAPF